MFTSRHFKEAMNNPILYNKTWKCRKKDSRTDIRRGIKAIVVYIFYR